MKQTLSALVLCLLLISPSAAAPRIPLVAGLTIVGVVHEVAGDRETFATYTSVTSNGAVELTTLPKGGSVKFDDGGKRILPESDLRSARALFTFFSKDWGSSFPGTLPDQLSMTSLADLKSKGVTHLGYTLVSQHKGPLTFVIWGDFRRVETSDVLLPVIVNGHPTSLPTIHIRGIFGYQQPDDLWILDDLQNPLWLKWVNMFGTGQQVKISYPVSGQTKEIQTALATAKRATTYGIYFHFDSATLLPESARVLAEIAQTMRDNTSWKLTIEGHTDNIGGHDYNMSLSKRRAEAVKAALASQYHIDAARMTAVGYGDTKPKASNDSLEGRALNRRVELVRI